MAENWKLVIYRIDPIDSDTEENTELGVACGYDEIFEGDIFVAYHPSKEPNVRCFGYDADNHRYNMRLISKAPEMLKILKSMDSRKAREIVNFVERDNRQGWSCG